MGTLPSVGRFGKVLKKYKDVSFVLILFPSVLIFFPFARYHLCWCMQTCNVYMDSTITFYFLFCRDSSITWQTIFNQGEWHDQSVIKMSWDRRRTNQNKCRTKKYPHFVLFSCRRFTRTTRNFRTGLSRIYIYRRTVE